MIVVFSIFVALIVQATDGRGCGRALASIEFCRPLKGRRPCVTSQGRRAAKGDQATAHCPKRAFLDFKMRRFLALAWTRQDNRRG
jgi:hypothetical protein